MAVVGAYRWNIVPGAPAHTAAEEEPSLLDVIRRVAARPIGWVLPLRRLRIRIASPVLTNDTKKDKKIHTHTHKNTQNTKKYTKRKQGRNEGRGRRDARKKKKKEKKEARSRVRRSEHAGRRNGNNEGRERKGRWRERTNEEAKWTWVLGILLGILRGE